MNLVYGWKRYEFQIWHKCRSLVNIRPISVNVEIRCFSHWRQCQNGVVSFSSSLSVRMSFAVFLLVGKIAIVCTLEATIVNQLQVEHSQPLGADKTFLCWTFSFDTFWLFIHAFVSLFVFSLCLFLLLAALVLGSTDEKCRTKKGRNL